MSILIKGVDMPKNCVLCFYRDNFHNYCPYESNKERDCPLIEVPTPHGRLIDADALQFGADVFLTREEAEEALKGAEE